VRLYILSCDNEKQMPALNIMVVIQYWVFMLWAPGALLPILGHNGPLKITAWKEPEEKDIRINCSGASLQIVDGRKLARTLIDWRGWAGLLMGVSQEISRDRNMMDPGQRTRNLTVLESVIKVPRYSLVYTLRLVFPGLIATTGVLTTVHSGRCACRWTGLTGSGWYKH
jgi:hypothetical protein